MFLGGDVLLFAGELLERTDYAEARVARFDDIVDVALLGGLVRVGEELVVFLLLLFEDGLRVLRIGLDVLGVENVHGTVGTHHGDVGGRPGVVDVAAELLAAHHDVGTAVALAEGDGHLRNRSLAIGVQKLRTVGDDGAVFLLGAGQEARDVHEGDQRDVERVAEAHEAGALAGGVDVEHAGEHAGLVGHDAHAAAAHVGEADDDVLREVLVDLEELAVIHDAADHAVHVVGLVGAVGDDVVEGVVHAADRVLRRTLGRGLEIVLREVGEEGEGCPVS